MLLPEGKACAIAFVMGGICVVVAKRAGESFGFGGGSGGRNG